MERDGAPEADLDVVGVGAEDEEIHGGHNFNSQFPTPNSQGESFEQRDET
jgi:hypothetical protein